MCLTSYENLISELPAFLAPDAFLLD